MCKRAPQDLFDSIGDTQDPVELRRLLRQICDCRDCAFGALAGTAAQDSGCALGHRLEFQNWLIYVADHVLFLDSIHGADALRVEHCPLTLTKIDPPVLSKTDPPL